MVCELLEGLHVLHFYVLASVTVGQHRRHSLEHVLLDLGLVKILNDRVIWSFAHQSLHLDNCVKLFLELFELSLRILALSFESLVVQVKHFVES